MKRRVFSGIQPTSQITLGNFLGAIKLFKQFEDEDLIVFVADLHALCASTYNEKEMQSNILNVLKVYAAAGLDFKKTRVFIQSKVPSHAELFAALINFTTIGELKRMTQFKDKSQKYKMNNGTETIPSGLLTYPVLMAADILLYDAQLIPVGIDQKQHVELTRNIAVRLNNRFKKELFTVPEPYFSPNATKIYDLLDPSKKMSKSSANVNGTIFLTDPVEITYKKIMSAVTDNLNQVNYDYDKQPGITNLLNIAGALLNVDAKELAKQHANDTYKVFKEFVAQTVVDFIKNLQEKISNINETELLKDVETNNQACEKIAHAKVEQFYKEIGLR